MCTKNHELSSIFKCAGTMIIWCLFYESSLSSDIGKRSAVHKWTENLDGPFGYPLTSIAGLVSVNDLNLTTKILVFPCQTGSVWINVLHKNRATCLEGQSTLHYLWIQSLLRSSLKSPELGLRVFCSIESLACCNTIYSVIGCSGWISNLVTIFTPSPSTIHLHSSKFPFKGQVKLGQFTI